MTVLRELSDLAATRAGLILTSDLAAIGWHPSAVQRLTSGGALVVVRRGVYAAASDWASASRDERYRLLVRATAMVSREDTVFSHDSAAAMHGLGRPGAWPAVVHVLHPDASGGRRRGPTVLHRGAADADTVVIDGVRVTSLQRTLVDMAITAPAETSVAMLDIALRRANGGREFLAQPDEVEELRAGLLVLLADRHAPRWAHRARASIEFADPLAESVGESFSRVRIRQLGFAVPELQVRFAPVLGSYARTDFYWRGIRRIGEFDGKIKYTRSRVTDGVDIAEIVYQEKLREDALRRLGEGVTRWPWSVLRKRSEFPRLLLEAGVPRAR
ncbi:type IV toxin-antitoxin system AbiEi family antitoxin domain-containing protein [Agromyces bauzanensis]